MGKEYVTDLDKLGMEMLLKHRLERRSGILSDPKIFGKTVSLESMQDLLKKDRERKKDGFPSKIKFRRVLTDQNKVISVPYVEEEQLLHGQFEPEKIAQFKQDQIRLNAFDDQPDIGESPGHGDGEVGDVIKEIPLTGDGDGDGDEEKDGEEGDDPGPDAGDEGADHSLEEEASELGRKLSERLQLPNLKDKPKKVPTDEYTYDLTDRHKGSGQVLDKKQTLKNIVKTNLVLNRINKDDLDPKKMIVGPRDREFRVLSKERIWLAQAVVCFMRDYSGSMLGEPTKALIAQHLMIYAWLVVQYESRVFPRFFVHDDNAKEVTAKEYFGFGSTGGTLIASGYKKINEVVEGESLESQYNIYVFQGTDGDDGDRQGKYALPELEKILRYANRMGVTLFKHPYYASRDGKTIFEQYLKRGGILERKDVFRLHIMPRYFAVTDEMNEKALKILIAQD